MGMNIFNTLLHYQKITIAFLNILSLGIMLVHFTCFLYPFQYLSSYYFDGYVQHDRTRCMKGFKKLTMHNDVN